LLHYQKDHQIELKTLSKFENWNHISVTLQERNGFDVVRRSDFFFGETVELIVNPKEKENYFKKRVCHFAALKRL
jgi:hypothetical protein